MLHLQLSTIIFQILNFLILLAVLSWFLFRPLLRVMRTREESITARLREAEESSQAAATERAQLEQERQHARTAAETLLAEARLQAADERTRILAAGRADVARLVAEGQQTIQEHERAALEQAERRVRGSAATLAGTLIRDAAGTAVHEQLLARFLEDGVRPASTDGAPPARIALGDNQLVDVELAYSAPSHTEAALRDLLARDLALDDGGSSISFRTNAALLAGLRVLAGEFVLDLSLQGTLQRLSGQEHG